ncbi:amino acid adenylation domain-containing protein [Pseudoxanthomonas japonensis]|uniref:non-ribosomal peptide synthetase n=1 Tax=Pseudoxanthomonas japonensis TaxID=69284 RepID=UPI002857E1F8|nr:non-ribosomal peptide synthetase [Pseudoxanthomonas japonensis]MDR7067470.1 amino acid adenylation domain-containing protein [Pseudoxanthomonas japonensis]
MSAIQVTGQGGRTRVDYDPFAGGALQRVVPTTEPQREVWLAAKLDHDASLAYNESVSLRLRGALDVDRLQVALRGVVERHDALRASIGPDGESFCVLEPQAFATAFEDLSALSPQARDAAVNARRQQGVDTLFVLEQGRLFRAELLRLQADDHLLLMHAHHIVCDGWSWWVIVRELGALYRGVSAALPAAASFAGYALDSAMHPHGDAHAADERYWLSRFSGELPVLELPLDHPRPMHRTTASAREDRMLDAALTAGVKKLGAGRGVSLFATLLNGFAALMSRISGQDRVVVGIPAAGQSVDGHEHLVGHCVNLLPLRFDLDHARSFADSLDAAQETLLDALDHQRYTFGTLLQQLRVARDPSRTPLISVLFNIDQALDPAKTGFQDLELDFTTNPRSHDNFELSVNAVQVDGQLRLECQYNRDLFDAATVRRWLAAYETLLRSAVDRPAEPMARLPLVDAPALAELAALQPAPVVFDRHCLMHEHFEGQCDRAPDRIAARHGDASLSYRQLEARANRIARLLRRHGIGRGALVGLALDRGLDMLAAMLGILKAGAGYVPLDPAFPHGRLAYMVEDAGLAALVTQRAHAGRLDLRGRPVLALDALESALAAEADGRLGRDASAAEAESTAYVIYTSGSTGKPKGVQLPHRAVANLMASMQRWPGMDPDDRLLAVTTLSFDISVVEMILPLSVGAQVVIADKSVAGDGQALAALLQGSRATVMQATPATWRVLLEAGWTGNPALKIFCGGEPMQPDLATALLARCGQLWNLYGPTETTVYSTGMRVMPATNGQRWPVIHIGRPLDNTQVWIMDAQGQLCPYGASGEICIGGEGVARGYLNRPELTAERFLPDMFADAAHGFGTDIPSPTLYRTGDRGRWRVDGCIEHMGRLDFQVKVRGFRIELGEIEGQLLAHRDISRAVAMAREDRPGDVRLVAYVVLGEGVALDDAALVTHLKLNLPDYMVPQHFVRLPAIPLLPNGKVDRGALPPPEINVARTGDFQPPRTPLEQQVASIMADVLGLPQMGLHDNFFASGGHSLLAAQLTSRLNRELSLGLSLRTLFDAPTVEKLATTIESAAPDTLPPRPPILHRADQREAPLSLIQERLKLMEEFNPGQLTYNTPSAHWLAGALDLPKFEQAFQAVMQRQSVLRTTIEERDGDAVQVVHDRMDSGLLDVEDLTAIPLAERERFLAQRLKGMIETPFDLIGSPLFRARLFKFDDDRHALMFMTHHIIWDGWSFDLLYRDLAETYAALLEGRAPVLPPLSVTYGDFSVWHHEWVASERYARQRAFWRDKLGATYEAGEGGTLDLSRGRSKRGTASGRGLAQGFHIDKALGDRLRKVGLGMDATLFVVLLSAYFVLLNRITGRRDMVIATPVRGRNSADVEELMGYFTNLLPLRVKIDPALPFSDAVKRVKDVVLDSFANPDIRLEEVAQELSSRGGQRMSALYQTLFSMQDIRQRVTRWGNLDHERLEVFQPGATEDLGLWILERDDGIIASMVYNADVLLEEDVATLRGHYVALLERIASGPHDHVDALGDFALPPVVQRRDTAAAPVAADSRDHAPAVTRVPGQDPRITYLIEVWSGMLDTRVSAGDNFFDLGGHSMLAVQMASRVAKDTGAKLKMMPLATQTLAQLAMELPSSMFAQEDADAASSVPTTDAGSGSDAGKAFFFGPGNRRLFGMRHRSDGSAVASVPTLLCVAPLLQEGIMSQRALWTLCEAVASQQGSALRFDWFGTGDSTGDTRQLGLEGMQRDLQIAVEQMAAGALAPRTLALRSACLPVLLSASAGAAPVDLVLWDPIVRGASMVDRWRRQHQEQLKDVGRYITRRGHAIAADELLGFDVAPAFLEALSALDFRARPLPSGSRVHVVVWSVDADVQSFIDAQQAAGVAVQVTHLATDDRPPWDEPMQFENQALPRRSVVQLAALLTETQA